MTAPGPHPPTAATLRLTLDAVRVRDRELDAVACSHPVAALKYGTMAANAAAVAGVEGHLFIADGANKWERQYLGELTVPDAWIAGWRNVLAERQAAAAAHGVELWNVVLPEKHVVYPEMRWPSQEGLGERRPFRLLQAQLEAGARVLYAADSLLAAKPAGPVWFRRNSHWNMSGCLIVAAEVAAVLDVQADIGAIPFAYRERLVRHDLATHLFDPAPEELAGFLDAPVETFFDNRLYATTGRNTGSSYGLRNPGSPDPRRVIVFGDSYSYDVGFTFALAAIFAEVVFVWSKAVDWSLVREHRAQLVIWESSERFLATLPQS